ncbi:MAG: J domain-containing protein, partial [Myxococcota bacterium]
MARRCSLDDPFAILEIPRDASDAEIKRAYRRLAKDNHPDRHPDDPAAEERFKRIAAAFELLSSAERRAEWLRDNGSSGSLWPASFVRTVEDAVARAQGYIEDHVLPHYVRYWRGAGAEAAVRLWQDAEKLVDGAFLASQGDAPGFLDRQRAAWWVNRVELSIEDWPMAQASQRVRLRDGRHRIAVLPFALWHGKLREPADVDDLVLQILIARYAQIWGDRTGALLQP